MIATSNVEMENSFCTLCNLRFASEAIYKIHSNILHKYKEDSIIKTKQCRARLMVVSLICYGEEQFNCLVCNSEFAKNEHLIRHNSLVHEPNSRNPEEPMFDFKGQKDCYVCEKSFQTNSALSRHISNVHSGKRYQCPKCEASFKQKGFL